MPLNMKKQFPPLDLDHTAQSMPLFLLMGVFLTPSLFFEFPARLRQLQDGGEVLTAEGP